MGYLLGVVEKNRFFINRNYNIDDYESIITFPKIDLKKIKNNINVYIFKKKKKEYKPESSSYWLPLHGPQSGAKICYSIPELFHT